MSDQVLVLAHDIEVVIGLDLEQVENLIQHLAVLAGDADLGLDAGRGVESLDDGSHLDRFRTRAEDGQHTGLHLVCLHRVGDRHALKLGRRVEVKPQVEAGRRTEGSVVKGNFG